MTTQEEVYQGFNIYLPKDLQARLDLITQTIPSFWEKKRYDHFTNHGSVHSERVHRQKLAQLAQELPTNQRLNPDEVFIVSAAAWLYEIGMQSPRLKPILDFECQPGENLTPQQLQEIRAKKHLLTYQMILDNVSGDYQEPPLPLGLTRPADEYTRAIAEVCLRCNDEPLEGVPETLPVHGLDIRVRLLTALLRLADQLYIGSERVDLELLVNRSRLTQREFARWWAYHYAQTLPVISGQIRFHYFMPESQKDYLGYMRGLIEPDFSYEQNATIRYLWEKHQLRLIPQKNPSARFDRQFGFQQLMSRELLMYLHQACERIETQTISEESIIERSLLILDYENFVIQLAREGHFLTMDKMSEAVVTLLKTATEQFAGIVDALAIGPWDRPDMVAAGKMLEDNIFRLLTIHVGENPAERLDQEIRRLMSDVNPPRQITLVAPQKGLARFTRELMGRGQQLAAWISNLPEAQIFQTVVGKHENLTRILSLPQAKGISSEELDAGQKACIIALDKEFSRKQEGLPYERIRTRLSQVGGVAGSVDFWCTWLFNRKVLLPGDHPVFIQLNTDSLDVIHARDLVKIIVHTFQEISRGLDGVTQDKILRKLIESGEFINEYATLHFLEQLKDEGILTRMQASVQTDNQPVWQLDETAEDVITANKEIYLLLFILALDHFMVREGRRSVHEHKMNGIVGRLIPERIAATFYEIAKTEKWVKREDTGEKFHGTNDPIFGVVPVVESPIVAQILRNQDILLNSLYHTSRDGITPDLLFQQLSSIKSFMLDEGALLTLIQHLETQKIVILERNTGTPSIKRIRLNTDEQLVKRLFGRMYVYGLVTTFRIRGATRFENRKPIRLLLDHLIQHVARHNAQLAEWTMDYATAIRLVRTETDGVYLNYHSLVKNLDNREAANCQALVELVKKQSRGRWLPQSIIFSEMEKDARFGYSRGEHEYWLNTAIYRRKLLEEKKEEKGSHQIHYVRAIAH